MPDKGFGKHIESCRKADGLCVRNMLICIRKLYGGGTYQRYMPFVSGYGLGDVPGGGPAGEWHQVLIQL